MVGLGGHSNLESTNIRLQSVGRFSPCENWPLQMHHESQTKSFQHPGEVVHEIHIALAQIFVHLFPVPGKPKRLHRNCSSSSGEKKKRSPNKCNSSNNLNCLHKECVSVHKA